MAQAYAFQPHSTAMSPRITHEHEGVEGRESAAPVHLAETRPVTRAGLIVNPHSGRGRGKGLALADALRHKGTVTVRVMERFEQIGGFLDDMAREDVSDLFISSGDGTIQEILTHLAERKPFRRLPRVGLLPHGTTNLTAADIGLSYGHIGAQADFIRAPAPRDVCVRPTIRCANPGDGKIRHGMFVGTGAVAVATRYCQQVFNDQGVGGQWAVARTLATAVRKYLFSRPDPDDPARFDRPYDITVDAGGRRLAEGQQLMQMSTTLDKLLLNTRPFWGGRTGSIRTSVFPYPVPSVARWMLPVMYGSENRTPPPGSVSFCSETLEVRSNAIFVIDGEFFPAPVDEALRLETGPAFTFLRG